MLCSWVVSWDLDSVAGVSLGNAFGLVKCSLGFVDVLFLCVIVFRFVVLIVC